MNKDWMYSPASQPIMCEQHDCPITVGGCPECRCKADEEAEARMGEEMMHSW